MRRVSDPVVFQRVGDEREEPKDERREEKKYPKWAFQSCCTMEGDLRPPPQRLVCDKR